ncbi:hypothetical protein E2C01_079395 [Portunus trituberculatus]|uniref:Uncharacterized protein n=1 Tax=Portunus trituberculatus TaxID=210409 RepID=A0A5B7IJG4_PORTR|nr:hypothetical protein [Portunus trituberculatus]
MTLCPCYSHALITQGPSASPSVLRFPFEEVLEAAVKRAQLSGRENVATTTTTVTVIVTAITLCS